MDTGNILPDEGDKRIGGGTSNIGCGSGGIEKDNGFVKPEF